MRLRLKALRSTQRFTSSPSWPPLLPDSRQRAEQELGLCLALGTALVATRGYAATEVERVFARARALCATVGDNAQRFRVIAGLCVYYEVGGALRTAHELAAELLAIADDERDAAFRVRADGIAGQMFLLRGDLGTARTTFDRGFAVL